MPTKDTTPPIARARTVTAYVLDEMRRGILTGRYPLGSKLDQQALAAEFGASVVPVRESLRQLEAEGLVEIYPHRGAFVTDVSSDELEEIYLIRIPLEELATRLAVPLLTKAALIRLADLLEEMEHEIEVGDYDSVLKLNRAFHFAIYEHAQRPLLMQIISTLWDRSTLYQRLYTYFPERATESHVEHQEIYTACKAGNPDKAAGAVRHNLETTVDFMLKNTDL